MPLGQVVETMRPLPLEAIAAAPGFIGGISIIRGSPVPVVEAAALFGDAEGHAQRLITLDIGGRPAALAVDAVIGVRTIPAGTSDGLPPLLGAAAGGAVATLRILDGELLLFLDTGRFLPEADLDSLRPAGAAS